jgi:2-dehydropantoate 2-reductase
VTVTSGQPDVSTTCIGRIGVVGAGAIGSIVGGLLTKAGRDVTLIDQWPDHVEAMRRDGLRLSGTCGEHRIPVRAVHLHEAQAITEPFGAAFVAVKGYDTEWATALACRHLEPERGVVVVFQNGMNDERVAAIAGRHRTLGCVITIGAGLYDPGHAIRTDRGSVGFRIGELDGRDTERARALVSLMDAVATARLTTNLAGERWSKLAVNCMANPLSGLSGLGSAEIRSEPGPRKLCIRIGAEVIRVGRAAGHEVEPLFGVAPQRFVDAADGRDVEAVEAELAAGVRHLAGGRPSFLQDVMRGRRTEIEELNGYVSRQGRTLGVPTPFNDAVIELVRRHGVGTLRPDPRHLDPLLQMLSR